MAARGKRRAELTAILTKALSDPGELDRGELEMAALAAARLRSTFLNEVFEALRTADPRAHTFEEFKRCLQSMGDLLSRAGIVSPDEMQKIWLGVEMF